jgi:CRISPR-associated exonuclease Cas4
MAIEKGSTYSEDDLLPLSRLADLLFCPRRAALHLLENIWQDNILTAEGRSLHERVHEEESESRKDLKIVRSLRLRSLRLGLIGVADVVEFHLDPGGISLPGSTGLWRAFPVEYKRGKLKHEFGYEVQLCAQAMCLEEMLGGAIPVGALFYGKSRRRKDVSFESGLRDSTEQAARQLHDLVAGQITPTARFSKKCPHCSLYRQCMPETTGVHKKIDLYLANGCELPTETSEL